MWEWERRGEKEQNAKKESCENDLYIGISYLCWMVSVFVLCNIWRNLKRGSPTGMVYG